MKKRILFILISAVGLTIILLSCSVKQKDLIGTWSTDFEIKVPNPDYKYQCFITLDFDDSVQLKGTMWITWEMVSTNETDNFKVSLGRYEIPFLYKLENNSVYIEGEGLDNQNYGSIETGIVKLKFTYSGGRLKAENVKLPCETQSIGNQNFYLKKLY